MIPVLTITTSQRFMYYRAGSTQGQDEAEPVLQLARWAHLAHSELPPLTLSMKKIIVKEK